jgi:hypothetical protein
VSTASPLSTRNRHTPSLDARIAALATRQHALVRHDQLLDLGLSRGGIAKRVERGALFRRHRGVYAVGHASLSQEGEWLAAVFGAGEGTTLGHASAANLHEVWWWRPPLIAVLSPRLRTLEGVKVHRYRRLDPRDVTTHKGIPVTTVHRTIVDLADVVQIPHELTAVIREADFKVRFVESAVRDVMARANGRHRLGVVDRAIELYRAGSAGIKSRNELAFYLLVTKAGYPEPLVNVHAHGFERDFHWPDLALAVEIDGSGHMRAPTRHADASRDASLLAAGYTVLRFTGEDVKFRPADVLTRLRTQAPHVPTR